MPLWGSADNANSAPKEHILATSNVRGSALYGNTTPSAFVPGQVDGVFGISKADIMTGNGGRLGGTSGWYLARWGTGPVLTITPVSAGSTGYANTDRVKVSGGTVNAIGNVSTNATGGLVSVSLSNPGKGFVNTSSISISVLNANGAASTGTGGSFTVILGGRAGRRMHECIATVRNLANTKSDTI